MENPVPFNKRLAILSGVFLFILISGVVSMQVLGGTTGSLIRDFYLVLSMFGLEGGWAFDAPTNSYLKILAFVSPLFTILGIIELFTRRIVSRALQVWKLLWIKDHVVIIGLTQESLLFVKSLRRAEHKKNVVILDQNPDLGLAINCRKIGVSVIHGDPVYPENLAKAKLKDASIVVSFVPDAGTAISLIFGVNKTLEKEHRKPLDMWLHFKDPEFGRKLGDYLKFANLSELVCPRFFNLNEVAARKLVRQYPPDVYADSFGQDQLHLAVYGYGNFAFEVIEEILLQMAASFPTQPKLTILSQNPKDDQAKLLAASPQIKTVAEVSFESLDVYATGIANQDYKKIPKDVTMHLVCYPKAEVSAAVSLSLRGLLLTPPTGVGKFSKRRLNAPIFARLSSNKGIAQLLESHIIGTGLADKNGQKSGDIPDGIFAFGMIEDLLDVDQNNPLIPTVIDSSREKAAKFLHFSYLYDLETLSKLFKGTFDGTRDVNRDWETLGPQFRESCRQEADHIWAKARLVRHRLLAKQNGEEGTTTNLSKVEKKKIAISEHQRWFTERRLAGWTYDKKRVDEAKRHNLLRPWNELSEAEAKLDFKQAERINAAAGHAGLVLKKELVIGVVGHRLSPDRPFDKTHVRKALKQKIIALLKKHPDQAPVLLTHLADGADTVAAEVALEMKIPFVVPLPLPFEVYRQDFEENGKEHVDKFLDLIVLADLYFELPLKFGDLVEVALKQTPGGMSEARKNQYALGGAYVAERADELIAVWDGKKARGTGGTADVVDWCKKGQIPKEFRSQDYFQKHRKVKPAIIIHPTDK